MFAYPFEDVQTKAQNYWRDVGTVDAYYEANLELVRVSPELNIYDEQWPIWTYQEQLPPAKFVFDDDDRRGCAIDSMVSGGCIFPPHPFPPPTHHPPPCPPPADSQPHNRRRSAADRDRFYVSEDGVTLVTASMLRAAVPADERRVAILTPFKFHFGGSFAC